MYPSSITLPNQLGEAYLPSLLHLQDEFEQPAVVGLVASDEVGSAAQHVVAVLRPSYERVELLTSVATADHYRLTPRLAYGVKKLVYEYMQQVVCTLVRAVVNALTQRCGAGG